MAKHTKAAKKKLTATQKLAKKSKNKAKKVLGTGLLQKAVKAIRKRKKLLDSI